MKEYGENKEIAFQMQEAWDRAAKAFPWWKLLYWHFKDKKQYDFAISQRLYPSLPGDEK